MSKPTTGTSTNNLTKHTGKWQLVTEAGQLKIRSNDQLTKRLVMYQYSVFTKQQIYIYSCLHNSYCTSIMTDSVKTLLCDTLTDQFGAKSFIELTELLFFKPVGGPPTSCVGVSANPRGSNCLILPTDLYQLTSCMCQ